MSSEVYCPSCKRFYSNLLKPPINCSCGQVIDGYKQQVTTQQETPTRFDIRRAVCNGCKFRVGKGCALYMKPCSVKHLWRDQSDPPQKCPRKEEFEEC